MSPMEFGRVSTPVTQLRQNSVVASELMILIFPHPGLEPPVHLRPETVELRPRTGSVLGVSGKLGDRLRERARETVARSFLKNERRRRRLVGLGRRRQRVLAVARREELVRVLRRPVPGIVSNNEIEPRLGAAVVRVGRAAVAVQAVNGPGNESF